MDVKICIIKKRMWPVQGVITIVFSVSQKQKPGRLVI